MADGITGPVATFLDIPEAPLLTLNMITPEGWLVETVHSNCDLDNIHLKDVSGLVRFCQERGMGSILSPCNRSKRAVMPRLLPELASLWL